MSATWKLCIFLKYKLQIHWKCQGKDNILASDFKGGWLSEKKRQQKGLKQCKEEKKGHFALKINVNINNCNISMLFYAWKKLNTNLIYWSNNDITYQTHILALWQPITGQQMDKMRWSIIPFDLVKGRGATETKTTPHHHNPANR